MSESDECFRSTSVASVDCHRIVDKRITTWHPMCTAADAASPLLAANRSATAKHTASSASESPAAIAAYARQRAPVTVAVSAWALHDTRSKAGRACSRSSAVAAFDEQPAIVHTKSTAATTTSSDDSAQSIARVASRTAPDCMNAKRTVQVHGGRSHCYVSHHAGAGWEPRRPMSRGVEGGFPRVRHAQHHGYGTETWIETRTAPTASTGSITIHMH
jgi:hypothetical protein